MSTRYTWKETKRKANIVKHGLDFIDADLVLESQYKYEIDSSRGLEMRKQVFSYVFDELTVLTLVYQPGEVPHVISFRHAHKDERELYYDWLENDYNDA